MVCMGTSFEPSEADRSPKDLYDVPKGPKFLSKVFSHDSYPFRLTIFWFVLLKMEFYSFSMLLAILLKTCLPKEPSEVGLFSYKVECTR